MNAPTLFDAAARMSDPATSHAAPQGDRGQLGQAVLDAVRWSKTGATTDEVWHFLSALGWTVRPNSIARRLTTLSRAGLIVEAGTRPGDSGMVSTNSMVMASQPASTRRRWALWALDSGAAVTAPEPGIGLRRVRPMAGRERIVNSYDFSVPARLSPVQYRRLVERRQFEQRARQRAADATETEEDEQ